MSASERSSTARSIDVLQGLTHDHVLGVHSYWVSWEERNQRFFFATLDESERSATDPYKFIYIAFKGVSYYS